MLQLFIMLLEMKCFYLPGTMSIRLSTRYTVVARNAASLSSAVPGLIK